MASSARRGEPQLLVDTSVAVALTASDQRDHAATFEAVGRRRLGLAGHAAFETFCVLTRLTAPARRTPAAVARLPAANLPRTRFPGEQAAGALLAELQADGIAGGSVYDALAGAAASQRRLPPATRDRRALGTYRALDVDVELLA